MPNPFRRMPGAAHRAGDWLVEEVGLCALLTEEWPERQPGGLALVGLIGSGKTAALDSWAARVRAETPQALLWTFNIGQLPQEDILQLERVILNMLIDDLGMQAFDDAYKVLWPRRGAAADLRADQVLELISQMLRDQHASGRSVHFLIDECQGPTEWLAAGVGPLPAFYALMNRLKGLAEAFRAGEAWLLITITPEEWLKVPPYVTDRFLPLGAQPPSREEIERFVAAGLARGGEAPQQVEDGLAGWIYDQHAPQSIRALHGLCESAWRRAHREQSAVLAQRHFAGD